MTESDTREHSAAGPTSGRRGVVVDRALSLVRLPAQTVLRAVRDTRRAEAVESVIDRADAAVRGAAGAALGDEGLRNDARALRARIESRSEGTKPAASRPARKPSAPAKKETTMAREVAEAKAKDERAEALQEEAEALEGRQDALEERQEALRMGDEALGLKESVDRAREESKRIDPDSGASGGSEQR